MYKKEKSRALGFETATIGIKPEALRTAPDGQFTCKIQHFLNIDITVLMFM